MDAPVTRFTLHTDGAGYGILDRFTDTVQWSHLPSGKPLEEFFRADDTLRISHRDQYTIEDCWAVIDMLNARCGTIA